MYSSSLRRLLDRHVHNRYKRFKSTPKTSNTICALASGKGKCGISVIRVSGPDSGNILTDFTKLNKLPPERKVVYKDVVDPLTGDTIDTGIILWFPNPRSFTGEDVCEFQVHGSPAVVNDLLGALTSRPNVRLAEPGEFSRRAFYNNKLDLTEIEGLADLLQAETTQQRKQAFQSMKGKLRLMFQNWRDVLIKSIAHMEAYIDFSESDDIDFNPNSILNSIRGVKLEMERCVEDSKKGLALKTGIQVPIYGLPNVGKSSFFNTITNSNRAIVSEEAGTTRDVLEKSYDVGGFPVTFLDTAGIRSKASNSIEKEGIARAVNALQETETYIHILICPMTDFVENFNEVEFLKHYVHSMGLSQELINSDACELQELFKFKTIVVMNKIDLVPNFEQYCKEQDIICYTSCKNVSGFDKFSKILSSHLHHIFPQGYNENPRLTSLRQKTHLIDCIASLENYITRFNNNSYNVDYVLATGNLRKALRALGFITGHVVNEEILDIMFEDFCVGK